MDVTRDHAWETLTRYTQSEALRRHALAVEACVGFYAREYGEDEQLWRATALLHEHLMSVRDGVVSMIARDAAARDTEHRGQRAASA